MSSTIEGRGRRLCSGAVASALAVLALGPGIVLAQSKAPSKIPSIVQQLVAAIDRSAALRQAVAPDLSNELVRVSAGGEIELVFHAASPTGSTEETDLIALGARIVATLVLPAPLDLPAPGMIQAWVPHDRVEAAASLPWVVAVTPPDYAVLDPSGTIVSEGVSLHRADRAQGLGITGAGVSVGVISDGVTSLAAAQAAGELPAVSVLAVGSGDEGTAMLEIVHDMAPDAFLLFAATGPDLLSHLAALAALRAQGADVIAEDIGFFLQPVFQQGVAAATGDAIAGLGTSMHSSAGNRGQEHAERVSAIGSGGGPDGFGGPFIGCPLPPTDAVAIAPGNDTTFDVVIPANTTAYFYLQWSEPRAIFPTAGLGGFTDLDLYALDATGTVCLAWSATAQGFGVGDPIEYFGISNPGPALPVKIVVNHFGSFGAAAPPILNLTWRDADAVDAPSRPGSLNPDASYLGLAASSAAVNAGTTALEGFSSGGPVELILTSICPGGVPGPCIGAPGPPSLAFGAPTVSGADGVSVSGAGGFPSPFFGTSAAAPHGAGCDALVRQGQGSHLTPVGRVMARLAATAEGLGPAGFDDSFGWGLLDCAAAATGPRISKISGTAKQVGVARPAGQVGGASVRVAGRFVSRAIDLSAASVEVERFLDERGRELARDAFDFSVTPLPLLRATGGSARSAVFRTPGAARPSARLSIRARADGTYDFDLTLSRAAIPRGADQCTVRGTADLMTIVRIDDGIGDPVQIATTEPWRCDRSQLRTPSRDAQPGPAGNKRPTASLRIEQLTRDTGQPSIVLLDGSGSQDRDGAIASYDFAVVVRDTGEVVFDPPPGTAAAIVTPAPGLSPGDYVASLTVIDDDGVISAPAERGFTVH